MVRKERLELSRHKTLEPKSSASTNFATSAHANAWPAKARTNEARDGGIECTLFQCSMGADALTSAAKLERETHPEARNHSNLEDNFIIN